MTNKKRKEEELRQSLDTLMKGTPAACKQAKARIEKLWHDDSKAFSRAAPVVFDYLKQFQSISAVKNKAAFASGLRIFYLTLADDYFEQLQDFTLNVVQHPDGHVREAIRKTADWLSFSLTSRIHPFLYPPGKRMTDTQQRDRQTAITQYRDYLTAVDRLLERYSPDPAPRRTYIDELPPSVFKSLELLWHDLASHQPRDLGHESSPNIVDKRKSIERELIELLNKTNSDFSLSDIKDMIFSEEEPDDMTKIIALFDNGQGAVELQQVMDTVSDAWNYFPHQSLGGLCPVEKLAMNHRSRGP